MDEHEIAELANDLTYVEARLNAEMAAMEAERARFDDRCASFNKAILNLESSRSRIQHRLETLGVKPPKVKGRASKRSKKSNSPDEKGVEVEATMPGTDETPENTILPDEPAPVEIDLEEPEGPITISKRKQQQGG